MQDHVDGKQLIVSILSEQESQSVFFLSQENVTRVVVLDSLSQGQSEKDAGNVPYERPSISFESFSSTARVRSAARHDGS